MKDSPKYAQVGVGVMIFKDGKILLAKRKGAHGEGEYNFPGGHLEYMESFEECALREIKEECGIEVKNIQFSFLANSDKYAPQHFVYIGLTADWQSGEPEVLEPDKSETWGWYDLDNYPTPIFEFCRFSIEGYKNNDNYFDKK